MPEKPPPPSRIVATLKALIRTRVTAGLLTVLPLLLTFWLLWYIFSLLRDLSLWVLQNVVPISALNRIGFDVKYLDPEHLSTAPPLIRWSVTGFALLLTFALLYAVGVFAANLIGRRIIDWFESLLARMPLVKSVYRSLKQILSLFANKPGAYQRVGVIPYPNQVARSVAFITNTIRDEVSGDELCVCFVPTAPNPTSGFVFIVPARDVVELDWTVEDAFKFILSGGIITEKMLSVVGAKSVSPTQAAGSR